jgi:hypothetical protein
VRPGVTEQLKKSNPAVRRSDGPLAPAPNLCLRIAFLKTFGVKEQGAKKLFEQAPAPFAKIGSPFGSSTAVLNPG